MELAIFSVLCINLNLDEGILPPSYKDSESDSFLSESKASHQDDFNLVGPMKCQGFKVFWKISRRQYALSTTITTLKGFGSEFHCAQSKVALIRSLENPFDFLPMVRVLLKKDVMGFSSRSIRYTLGCTPCTVTLHPKIEPAYILFLSPLVFLWQVEYCFYLSNVRSIAIEFFTKFSEFLNFEFLMNSCLILVWHQTLLYSHSCPLLWATEVWTKKMTHGLYILL